MTQIAVASDEKLKIGPCQREDVVGVTDANSSQGIHFPSTDKKGERRIQSHLKKISENSQNSEQLHIYKSYTLSLR